MTLINPEVIDFKKYLITNNITGIALDIDNTLSSTNQDWFDFMVKKVGNPENLSYDQFSKKYHILDNAPYYQTQEAKKIIYDLTFSPKSYSELTVLDNSSHFVNKLNEIVPVVAYITMRPQSINIATQDWLDKHDFPKAKLIARVNSLDYYLAMDWKKEVLEELHPNIVGIVDDSQGIADRMSSNYKGSIYLYNYDKENYRTDINIHSCANWQSVLDKIKL